MNKTLGITILILVVVGVAVYANREVLMREVLFKPTESNVVDGNIKNSSEPSPTVVVENLNIPWEIEFLPGGDILVTERAGKLLRIGADKKAIEISGVAHRGEGGLLGLALDPDFVKNNFIYLYLTTSSDDDLSNQVERYKLDGTTLSDRKVIISGIPGASIHDGGRIDFGPDGKLYITTGDAGTEKRAQDTKNLGGKILRINSDGSIPADNPFGNAVYSYGHRNSQGLAWDTSGTLWATEHGRSGLESGYDELNKITKGANYGWPTIEGSAGKTGMLTPDLHSGAKDTWAPAGMEYLNGHLIFAGLRGQALYVVDISTGKAGEIRKYFSETYGRLRTAKLGPDGMLYILTNNRDGRGTPKPGDDRIIKVDPGLLNL